MAALARRRGGHAEPAASESRRRGADDPAGGAESAPMGTTWQGWPWLQASAWAYPTLEVAHIVGIAFLVGPLVLVELRVWGAAAPLPAPALARAALPVSGTGFALVAISGAAMFASQPQELLAGRLFAVKLALVAAAGVNAVVFHLRDGIVRRDAAARAQTVLSLGLWLAVIICGRWIAYV